MKLVFILAAILALSIAEEEQHELVAIEDNKSSDAEVINEESVKEGGDLKRSASLYVPASNRDQRYWQTHQSIQADTWYPEVQNDYWTSTSAPQVAKARTPPTQVLKNDFYLADNGDYKYEYQTGDGTHVGEQGYFSDRNQNEESLVKKGWYSFVGANGITYKVIYWADSTGYHAYGAHIPGAATPPAENPTQQGYYEYPSQTQAPVTQRPTYPVYKPPQATFNPPPPTYNPPQTTYNPTQATKPEQTYNPPQQTYNPPQQTYNPPQQTYNPPKPTYNPPQQTNNPPQQTYNPPETTYNTPKPTYNPPQQTYKPPQQSYDTPQQTYNPPQQTYNPIQQTYNPPQQTYNPSQQTYNPPQQTYNPLQQTYNPPQQTYNPSQQTYIPSNPSNTLKPIYNLQPTYNQQGSTYNDDQQYIYYPNYNV